MEYSWKLSIQNHLQDHSYMSRTEYAAWQQWCRYQIPMSTILTLAERSPLDSIEFTDALMQLLFENMGDYQDLLPYSADSLAQLNADELEFFNKTVSMFKQEIEHVQLRLWAPLLSD